MRGPKRFTFFWTRSRAAPQNIRAEIAGSLVRTFFFLVLFAAILLAGSFFMKLRAQSAQSGASAQNLEGTWSGALGAGTNKLHIILTIAKSSDGYVGSLNSVDQNAVIPMANISLDGSKVHFELKPVGGVYDGTLSADGKSIAGTWVQSGVPPQPLSFDRGAASEPESTATPPGPDKMPLPPDIDVTIPIAPTAFVGDGKWHLVYELHVTNLDDWDCRLTRLGVLPAAVPVGPAQKPLAVFDAAYLNMMARQPAGPNTSQPTKLAPDRFAIVFVWVTLDRREDVPASITQRISMRVGTYPEELTIETAATPVDLKPVAVISPPLTGDNWLAANGPSNTSPHRRAFISVDGRGTIGQRFAIDWLELYPDGKSFQGDPKDNKSYRAYGAEIRAVADGVVTEVKDGIPQNVPGATSRAVPITLETIAGNHVILQIGDGLYAAYAHMQPGSIRVKLGEKVRRGEVLGLLGNSGNSTEPHLHFQICNANSVLACEGLPYAIASFEVQGKGFGWKSSESKDAPVKRERELPLEGDVVRFTPQD